MVGHVASPHGSGGLRSWCNRKEIRLTWEHFAHGADIGVRGRGATVADAFAQAALALTAVVADPERIAPGVAIDIRCEAPDVELLLADWLNAVIYAMATHAMLFSRFDVRIDGPLLTAKGWGEPLDRARHQPAVEIKGATYTGLSVGQSEDGSWIAQCVVDV